MIAIRTRKSRIRNGSPLTTSHWLNRGRLAWWISLPNWNYTTKIPDLVSRNDGILGSIAGRSSIGLAGGWKSLYFSSSVNSQITASDAGFPAGTGNCTIAISFRTTASPGAGAILFGYGTLASNQWRVLGFVSNSLLFSNYGSAIYASGTWNDGADHRAHLVYNYPALSIYVDGIPRALNPAFYLATTLSQFTMGGNGSGQYYDGWLDNCAAWNYAMSADQVLEEYVLSLKGYPGVFNRQNPFAQSHFTPTPTPTPTAIPAMLLTTF